MERLPIQSVWWRGFALCVFGLLLLMSTQESAPINGWETARAVYWWIAPLGLIGYAFGLRVLSVTFWRVYAAIFTVEIIIRTAPIALLPLSRVLGWTDSSRYGSPIVLLATAGIALTCLALFRYADIVGGGRTEIEPRPASPPRREMDRSYSLIHCAVAAVTGSYANSLALSQDFDRFEFPWIFFIVGLFALATVGRPLARKFAATGRDTIVRGLLWGALAGSAVGAGLALVFVLGMMGPRSLSSALALLTTALLGVGLGILNGAVAGGTFVLIGRSKGV